MTSVPVTMHERVTEQVALLDRRLRSKGFAERLRLVRDARMRYLVYFGSSLVVRTPSPDMALEEAEGFTRAQIQGQRMLHEALLSAVDSVLGDDNSTAEVSVSPELPASF